MDSLNEITFKVVARMRSDFPDKFGIPRQSGLLKGLCSTIVFEPTYRNVDALRGLEGFSHLWVLWLFSENLRSSWKPTVRPPRLGGNARLGVFATRSSFRPNPIAMSCVKIEEIRLTGENAPFIIVSGGDLMDGTPIVDIKPYLPYADSIPEAVGGFAEAVRGKCLQVEIPLDLTAEGGALQKFPAEKWGALEELLSEDPRPAYQRDENRIYGFKFAGFEIKFKVDAGILKVVGGNPL